MNKITLSDLRTRQAWPLEQKIDHTVGAIEAFINYCEKYGRKPYVSFSGGLNSTVLLDIARRFVDPDMPGVFCSTGNEWPEIVSFVRHTPNVTIIRPQLTPREVIARHGFPLVSKEQAQGIYEVRHCKGEKTLRRRLEAKPIGNDFKEMALSHHRALRNITQMLRLTKKKPNAQILQKQQRYSHAGNDGRRKQPQNRTVSAPRQLQRFFKRSE